MHNEHYKHCGIDEFLWQTTKIYDIIHIVFYGYTSCKLTGINLLIIKKRTLSRYPSCLIYWDKILNLSEICHMEKDFAVFFFRVNSNTDDNLLLNWFSGTLFARNKEVQELYTFNLDLRLQQSKCFVLIFFIISGICYSEFAKT